MIFLGIYDYIRNNEGTVTVESHDYGFESREDRALQRPLPANRGSLAPRAPLARTTGPAPVSCEFAIVGGGKYWSGTYALYQLT